MINVLTLKYGDKYGPEYVNRLYRGLVRNSTVDFNFICYTDQSEGIEGGIEIRKIPEEYLKRYKGHWLKLIFHKTGFVEPGTPCIIMDIDWVIVGDIDPILNYPLEHNTFTSVYRWWSNRREFCPMNGGLQMFYNGDTNHLWEKYSADPDYWREYYYNNGNAPILGMGEQNFIYSHLNMPLKFLPRAWFGRVAKDPGITKMITDNWFANVDPYDPFLIGDEINSQVKMIHFASDFKCFNNDNHIESHKWIGKYWHD
jgi:hypothetical protein